MGRNFAFRAVIVAFVYTFALVSLAHATLPEICANGLDDDSSGGDAVCNFADGYINGQTTATQCLDSNLQSVNGIPIFQVLHGEMYPCNFGAASNTNTSVGGAGSNTGYHVCNSDGSWGTCISNAVTPLCESQGSGHCRYIDYGAGSDTTGDGSYNNPWKTFRCVGYFTTGAPGCNIGLNPGDVVYQKGTTNYTDSYSYDGTSAQATLVLNSSRSGNSTYPVTIKRYPGATGTIIQHGGYVSGTWPLVLDGGSMVVNNGFGIWLLNASYIKLVDLDISGGYGSTFYLNPGDHTKVYRNYVHDVSGYYNNNISGVNSSGSIGVDLEWNRFKDIADNQKPSAPWENVTCAVMFNDDTGGDHTMKYNRCWYSNDPNYGGSAKGWGLKFKHGAAGVAAGGQTVGNNVQFNIVWNAQVGIASKTSSTYVQNNLVVNPANGDYCYRFEAGDGHQDFQQDEKLISNTCYGGHLIDQSNTATCGTSPLCPCLLSSYCQTPYAWDIEKNVNYDTYAYAGDTAGIEMDQYGVTGQYSTYIAAITLKNNLLWNTNASGFKWGFMAATAGANYTSVASVQGIGAGLLESGTFAENPTLSSDGSFTPSSAHYTNQGWLGAVAPTPTPTPTPGGAIDKRGRRIGAYNYHTR